MCTLCECVLVGWGGGGGGRWVAGISHTSQLIRLKFDMVMKQFKLNV